MAGNLPWTETPARRVDAAQRRRLKRVAVAAGLLGGWRTPSLRRDSKEWQQTEVEASDGRACEVLAEKSRLDHVVDASRPNTSRPSRLASTRRFAEECDPQVLHSVVHTICSRGEEITRLCNEV